MPSYQPVIKNGGAIFYLSLLDAAAAATFRLNPTLAAGDFKVSVDGAAFANMTTLPTVTPAAGGQVKFTLSAAETNGDNISVMCVDQTAPKEWVDAFIRIQTAAGSFDTIQADADNIQTRLPAALVGGRMDSSVGAMAADVLTASAIATDAIGSAELAATAVTKIQTGLPTVASITALQADTDDIQARLPSALVGGKMESNVGSMTTDVVTAAALAAGAVTEIQAGLATAAAVAALPTAASIAALQADTDNLQTRVPAALVGGRMDVSLGAVQTATNLGYTVPSIGRGTVGAGASDISLPTTAFTPAGGSLNQFAGRVVLFDFDTLTVGLRGCARGISASSLAALPTLTIDQLPTIPSAGDTFSVL